jgi:large subunit ribosomal protein L25
MKEILTLSAEQRTDMGTRASRRLRSAGRVPAVIYGHQEAPVAVAVDQDALESAIRHHTRMMDIALGDRMERVLLTDVQHDVFGRDVIHADFIRVAMDEVVRIEVPVVMHGHAIGETHGGVTEQVLDTVEIECLPGDIPEEIRVVVTKLDVGESVHVRDLQAPENTKVVSDGDLLVLTVAQPTVHAAAVEEEAAPLAGEGEEPELIGRGKEEAEEEAEE